MATNQHVPGTVNHSSAGQPRQSAVFAQVGRDSCMWVDTGRTDVRPMDEPVRSPLPMGHDSSMWVDDRLARREDGLLADEIPVTGTVDRTAITKKIKIGKKTSAQAGWHQGGATPFGYRRRFDPIDGHAVLVKDDKQASVVAEIFRAYVRTASLEKVRIQLDDAGLKNSDDKGWSRSSLAFLLANRTYTGLVKFGGEGHVGRHEAIVSEELFEAARQIRTKRYKRRR